jgi:hypothetical protein
MWLPSNLIFLVLLGIASPLYAQNINDAPNITNQEKKPKIKSTIIPGWEDSAAIAFLVLLAVIVISVPCVIILIRIRRKNRNARRLTSRGAPTTAENRTYENDDYEMGTRHTQTEDVLAAKGKEGWTLKEIEVYMRGGDPNTSASFPASQHGGHQPSTSASVQSQQEPVAPQAVADATQAKPVGISRATSVKVTKVKAVTVVKAGRGGDGSTLGGASGASSPRRPETALTRVE